MTEKNTCAEFKTESMSWHSETLGQNGQSWARQPPTTSPDAAVREFCSFGESGFPFVLHSSQVQSGPG